MDNSTASEKKSIIINNFLDTIEEKSDFKLVELEEYQNKINTILETNSELELELYQKNKLIEELLMTNTKLNQNKQELIPKASYDYLTNSMLELSDKLSLLTKQYEDKEKELQTKLSDYESLKIKLNINIREFEQLSATNEVLERSNREKNDTIKNLTKQIQKLTEKNLENKTSIDGLYKRNDELTINNMILKNDYQLTLDNLIKTKSITSDYDKKLMMVTKENGLLKTEIDNMKSKELQIEMTLEENKKNISIIKKQHCEMESKYLTQINQLNKKIRECKCMELCDVVIYDEDFEDI